MGKSSFSFASLSADRVGRGLGFKREFSALDGEASCPALYPEIKPLRFSFLFFEGSESHSGCWRFIYSSKK